ncbi:muscle M-line assembly protein unc-89-like [Acanthaster planci]|uniref:Muscle M-line assembly protein unc-89-like n=1 Tax=Acanthaster planci TaxID=133434 RepID=A0A8B7ZB51_ACAPL|nr:muscle M-line assembly protein unc-89-like [Acanthaster planci]
MAAILSIYIDVSVVLSRDSPDTAEAAGRLTLSQILLLIGPSPVQQLNLLLQVTQPSSQDCHFMIPIYRHMLSSKPSVMTNEAFIKYICAIRFSQQILMNQKEQAVLDVLQHIMGIAMTAEPSIEFLQWLYSTAPDAYSSLPDSVKSTTSLLVKYLTGEASRDYLDRLLDIVCDEEIESQTLSYKDSQSEPRLSSINSQDNQAEISETEGLFFTDTSRDEDLARQVDSDSELVDALHSRLDALIEGIDQEENSEDDDNFVQVGKPSNVKVQSEKNGIAALMSLDSDNQSDYEEVDMDTSGTVTSEQNAPEALSFEEQRYKLQMKAQKKVIDVSDASQNEEGGTPRMRGKSRNQKPLSLSSRRDEEEVLVIPETQDNRPERDSDRESFATAKDNLDSTRESVIIDVDEEITFRVKAAHQRSHKDGDPQAEDVEKQNKDSVVNLEDEEQVRDTSSPSSYKPSRTKAKSRHLQSSQETVGKPNKKQEQASDEMSGSTQRMSLRSVSAGHNQSSLLRFFSPVSRNIDESNSQPDQNPESGKISQLDRVEIVPDSYSSFDEEIEKYDQRRKIRASQRFKNLKSLQRIRANSKQEESPGISQLPEGINSTPAPTKQNRLSRSGRKMGSTRKQVIYSSNSGEEPAILDSPILRPSQTCEPRSQASDQKSPAVEDVVSEGIRRIWEECTTASSDLPTSVVTKSASKRKPPKRKSLTITGGIKSKSLAVSTPRQPTKQAEGPTPAEKTVSESAEKPQGVSPLSPSKVKRVATFGDTYRLLAGISADSQSDPCSLPASQSQKTSPKRARLQPKALKMMFDKDTPSNQKRSAKTQTADFQEISASSQESNSSFVAKKPSRKPRRLASPSKKTPVRTSSKSSQESSAGQARQGKRAMTRESPYASLRFDDADSPKTAVKRRASLFVSQTTTKAESNVKRKSTGTAT